jgi:hypothetical protein
VIQIIIQSGNRALMELVSPSTPKARSLHAKRRAGISLSPGEETSAWVSCRKKRAESDQSKTRTHACPSIQRTEVSYKKHVRLLRACNNRCA